jgi:glycosyltransferase involved in cell wall biosynthesis
MRILFFTPYGGISGSETMLFHLLSSIDREAFEVALFSRERGRLMAELAPTIPCHTFDDSLNRLEQFWERMKGRPRFRPSYDHFIIELHKKFRPDLWYINTLIMPEAARLAIQLNVPYVAHAHELPMVYNTLRRDDLANTLRNAALVIGCSQAAADCLRLLSDRPLELQYECIAVDQVRATGEQTEALRQRLGISAESFVWGMSGLIEYRKGADLFLEAARLLKDDNKIQFVWIGGQQNTGFQLFIDGFMKHHELKNVHFVGRQTTDYYSYLGCLDGFMLTSREDPFPLVMIEAAALGKPIVSFDSGGVREFLQSGMGRVMNSWAVQDMVAAMKAIMSGEVRFNAETSKTRAAEFDVSIQVRHLERLLHRYFAPQQTSTRRLKEP